MRPEVLADTLATTIRGLVAPLSLRMAALETIGAGLETKAATLETKAAELETKAAALETATGTEVTEVRARLAVLEARDPLPGPPGPPGAPGRDGRDGLDGKDGKGLTYLGVHVTGKSYDVGDLVTAGGSAWYCGKATTSTPGSSTDWQLMVKRGRDARGDR